MEKILRTDNAYTAIDKINDNFKEVVSMESVVIAEGSLGGANKNFVFAYLEEVVPGDMIHIDFPGGNWADITGLTSSSAKLSIGYRDNTPTAHAMMMVFLGETVQGCGYDVYVSPGYSADYKDLYIAIRAATGTNVKYKVSRVDRDKVKDYFASEMADTVQKVKARQTDGCFTFAMVTDIHYRSNNDGPVLSHYAAINMGANLAEFSKRVRLDNVVCLGDVIDGLSTAFQSNCDAQDMMRVFGGIKAPLINVVGNHDDNRYYSQGNGDRIFTQQEIVSNFIVPVDERTSVGGAMGGCNYYRDVDRLKLRLVVLMGIDFEGSYYYTSDTRAWLADTYSSLPEGYKAVLFTHVPPLAAQSWNNTQYTGGILLAGIISENIDKTVCLFEGHTHLDNTFVSPYFAIMSSSQKCYTLGSLTNAPEDSIFPTRAAGDYREDLWNAVVIDQTNSLVSVIRFGAGNDRYVHLTPVEVPAGSTATLTPSVITASSWTSRSSESSSISIADGVVTVDSAATSDSRLTARAVDSSGNMEIWCIKVS